MDLVEEKMNIKGMQLQDGSCESAGYGKKGELYQTRGDMVVTAWVI